MSPQGLLSPRSEQLPARSTVTRTTAAAGTAGLIAIATVDGLVASWLEGDTCLIATVRTRRGIHLTCLTAATAGASAATTSVSAASLIFACSTTGWTTTWGVREVTTRVKFLFTYGEDKLLIAVATNKGLIS